MVLLDKTETPRPPSVASLWPALAWFLVHGVWWVFYCLFLSGRLLAQFELEGGDLHGIQTDGGVVGQGRTGVHQSQGHGLEQLQVQVLEQS